MKTIISLCEKNKGEEGTSRERLALSRDNIGKKEKTKARERRGLVAEKLYLN